MAHNIMGPGLVRQKKIDKKKIGVNSFLLITFKFLKITAFAAMKEPESYEKSK